MDTNFYEQYSPYRQQAERGPQEYIHPQERKPSRLQTPGIHPPVNWGELSKIERMKEIRAEEEQFRRESVEKYDVDASR